MTESDFHVNDAENEEQIIKVKYNCLKPLVFATTCKTAPSASISLIKKAQLSSETLTKFFSDVTGQLRVKVVCAVVEFCLYAFGVAEHSEGRRLSLKCP